MPKTAALPRDSTAAAAATSTARTATTSRMQAGAGPAAARSAAAGQPAVRKAVAGQRALGKPTPGKPAPGKPAPGKLAAGKPAAGVPASATPLALRPATEASASTPPAAKPDGQYHHGDLQRSLVEWGTHLLDTEGAESMSLRAIARMAGVSPAAPAHHFKDKNGLLAAIAAQGFRDMAARSGFHGQVPGGAAAQLHAVARDYVHFAAEYPARFQLMFGMQIAHRAQYPELTDAALVSYNGLIAVVAPLLGGKAARAMSVEDFTFCVWSTMHGLAVMASNRLNAPTLKARLSIDDMAALFARYVLATIRGLTVTLPAN